MSDDLDLHGIDQRHEPDPQFRAALQRRLAAIVAGADPGSATEARDLAMIDLSDEQLVPVKETYVSLDSPTRETRHRRRLAMAAAAVVAVVGVAAIAINRMNSDDDVEPAPAVQPTVAATTVAPTTVATTTTVASTTKTVSFPVPSANDIPVTFTVPDDWVVDGGPMAYVDNSGGHGLVFDGIANIYADGCQWVLLDPPVGPTVDDLVAAWANLPGFAATAAVDVTVDGYAGKKFELTVPDYNLNECKEKVNIGRVYALYEYSGMRKVDAPGYFAWFADPNFQIWVLDVDGTRLVITANFVTNTSPQNRAALDKALASIQIG